MAEELPGCLYRKRSESEQIANVKTMAAVSEQKWKEAFQAVKAQFEITDLLPEQQDAIKAFFKGKDVFVNLPTGFGKSLIFQCLPLVADSVHDKPRGSSVIVVISPLRSLMEDQVQYLNSICIPAIAITDVEDPEAIQQVLLFDYRALSLMNSRYL